MVIAHRLSTIRGANTIVVLKYGEIVEQGNHEELVALGGTYKALVDRQMQRAKVTQVLEEKPEII